MKQYKLNLTQFEPDKKKKIRQPCRFLLFCREDLILRFQLSGDFILMSLSESVEDMCLTLSEAVGSSWPGCVIVLVLGRLSAARDMSDVRFLSWEVQLKLDSLFSTGLTVFPQNL